jgi:hypothetical protein
VKLTRTNRPFGLIIKLSQTVAIGLGSFCGVFLPAYSDVNQFVDHKFVSACGPDA